MRDRTLFLRPGRLGRPAWHLLRLFALTVAQHLTACGSAGEVTPFAPGELARVDGEVLTASDLRQRFFQGPLEVRKRALRPGGRHALLGLVIDERLLYAEAKRRNLAPSFLDIGPFHERLMKRFLAAEFEPTISKAQVTDEEIQQEYDQVRSDLTAPPRRRIRVFAAKTRGEAEALLIKVRGLHLEQNEEALSQLLTKQQEDQLGSLTGDFELENAATYLGDAVAQAAWATDVAEGVAPEPVEFHDLWGVVNVLAEYDAVEPPPLAKVAEQMRARVFARQREEALDQFVNTFRDRHEVVIHQGALGLIPWTEAPPPTADPSEAQGE